MVGLPGGENSLRICLLISTQYANVMASLPAIYRTTAKVAPMHCRHCMNQFLIIVLGHNGHYECRPACEWMTTLASTSSVTVLLPDVPRRSILMVDIVDNIFSQFVIQTSGHSTVWPNSSCGIMPKGSKGQVVHVDPDAATPVWWIVLRVVLPIQRRRLGQ